jgi:hypothetical protein
VAGSVIQATERSEFEDGLGSGDFVSGYSYHMSVRTRLSDHTMQTKFQSQRPSDVIPTNRFPQFRQQKRDFPIIPTAKRDSTIILTAKLEVCGKNAFLLSELWELSSELWEPLFFVGIVEKNGKCPVGTMGRNRQNCGTLPFSRHKCNFSCLKNGSPFYLRIKKPSAVTVHGPRISVEQA